ncbi:RNA polymerase sigma factor [Parvicella tangerina]|uniref:ECF RNA polymerase sigma factor SigM n=1 Tax=Parvicella tangerina TaxID=2829795 RepID=A0A916JKG4_9FLAO|nr:sigma-70 family RNA polymerase sigma factor [Parvicella tangerina]CAG5077491.1 ECF RNA polymerase sigma factor SigM [Parvicella tangerina]
MQVNKTSKYHQTSEQLLRENEIIEAAKKNPERFEPIYKKYHEQIFRYVYQRMDSKDQAFDVTSQIFLKAITKLHKYEFRGVPFSSWLYRIAMSEVYQYLKDRSSERTVNVDTSGLSEIIDDMEDEERIADKKKLIKLIGELPDVELQIIEMRYFEKRSYREIGEILGIAENNAKVKSFRIVGKLRKAFQQQ